MKIEISNVKGFQDFLPPESLKRDTIKKIIERNFKIYGFIPIETPVIEFDEFIRGDSIQEEEAVSDRFKLKDRGGRNLGLRYEFTFQLARIFKQNPLIKLPFKRYQIGEVFRDEPTGPKRFRQFTQCDIDIIGDSSQEAEAEILSCFSDILKELNIKAEIEVNNRKLIQSLIESVQIENIKEVMRELDKIDKIGEDNVKANLRKYADVNQIITLFKLLEKDIPFFKDNAFEGVEELQNLIKECELYNIQLKMNPFLVRGLNYYTGNIFEIKTESSKESLAGGGRYDKVVGKYIGKDIPAVGISFGLERLTDLADVKIESIPNVLIISIEQKEHAIKLIKKLRNSGVSCSLTSDKINKALEYANSLQIPYVILLGEKEIEQKKINLRNMSTGEERMLTEKQLLRIFAKK